MKKFLSCFLATVLICGSVATVTSCNFLKGNPSTSSTEAEEDVVSLSLTKKAYNIEDEQSITLQIEFTINGMAGDLSLLTYTSSNPTVATVDANGTVTGVTEGKAYITVAYGDNSVKATINVKQRVYKITLSEDYFILPINAEQEVTATAYYGVTELTDEVLAWTSSDPSVATVENGKIKGLSSGIADVTVKSEHTSKNIQVSVVTEATEEQVNTFSEEYVNVYGRSYILNKTLRLDHAANAIEVGFIGKELKFTMYSNANGYMRVFVDDSPAGIRLSVAAGSKEYTIASSSKDGYHLARIVKCTEEQQNAHWSVESFHAEAFCAAPKKSNLKIEFIGDSITAGHGSIGRYGQEHTIDNSDATRAYAYLTAQALRADYSIVAYSGICTKAYHWLKNLNMQTLYSQISNTNKQSYAFTFEADVVVLNLGTNEASYLNTAEGANYGLQFSADYQAFLQTIRAKHPNAHIICLYGMGDRSSIIHTGIQKAISDLNDANVVYNPFPITGDSSGGNNHPGAAAHQTWANDLTAYIRTLL